MQLLICLVLVLVSIVDLVWILILFPPPPKVLNNLILNAFRWGCALQLGLEPMLGFSLRYILLHLLMLPTWFCSQLRLHPLAKHLSFIFYFKYGSLLFFVCVCGGGGLKIKAGKISSRNREDWNYFHFKFYFPSGKI